MQRDARRDEVERADDEILDVLEPTQQVEAYPVVGEEGVLRPPVVVEKRVRRARDVAEALEDVGAERPLRAARHARLRKQDE